MWNIPNFKSALGCVGDVVGALAVLCFGEDKSEKTSALWWSENKCWKNEGIPVHLLSVLFTCASCLSLFFVSF